MKGEPFFLVNEFLEKEREELENIISLVEKGNVKHLERAEFLKNFTNSMFCAHRETKKQETKIENQTKLLKEQLLKKKQELLNKLNEKQGKIKKSDVKPTQVEEKPKEEKKLILSKESGKILVKTEFVDGTYFIREPELNQIDFRILNELKSLNIEDKQKLIDKIKELCKNYKISYSEQYYDNLRYYLIRDKKKFGRITPLIEDQEIKEIVCKGANKFLTVKYKDRDDIATNIVFDSDQQINTFVRNIAEKTKQETSDSKPFLNVKVDNMIVNANIQTQFLKPKFVIVKE